MSGNMPEASQFNPVDTPKESDRNIQERFQETSPYDEAKINAKARLRNEHQKEQMKNLSRNATERLLKEPNTRMRSTNQFGS